MRRWTRTLRGRIPCVDPADDLSVGVAAGRCPVEEGVGAEFLDERDVDGEGALGVLAHQIDVLGVEPHHDAVGALLAQRAHG
jgi:hypothetical protein